MALGIRKAFKRDLSGLAARVWGRPDLDLAGIKARRPRRILIVRPHNQMGDMVCATPALRAIRETFPEARIALVCAPVNREVVLHNPHIDQLFTFDKAACTRPGPLLAFVRALRRFAPDLAFVLNSVSFSVSSAVLARLSGAGMIIGSDSAPYGFDIARHVYSLVMPSTPVQTGHAVAHNLAPLRAIGIDTADSGTVVVPSAAETALATRIIAGVPGDGPLWIMHPGAGKAVNLWPTRHFADLAVRAVRSGRRVLVLQGPADAAVAAAFVAGVEARLGTAATGAVALNPPVPVGVCAALLQAADRFLCNDTGLMHVAGAVGVPTLALFGPTDPALWAPLHPLLESLRAPDGRLEALEPDGVWSCWQNLRTRIIEKG